MWSEGQARLTAVRGIDMMSFTPMKGRSAVFLKYVYQNQVGAHPKNLGFYNVRMAPKDSLHITKADVAEMKAKYPATSGLPGIDGDPVHGEGLIYPVDEADFKVEPFEIPDWWPLLGGIDFGYGHPAAAVKIAHNLDSDVVYVTDENRKRRRTPAEQATILRKWGKDLKWAWPRDGHANEKGTGEQLAKMYKDEGMKMLPMFAQWKKEARKSKRDSGGSSTLSVISTERGLTEILDRLKTGRLKVFSTCSKWLSERRTTTRRAGRSSRKRTISWTPPAMA